MEFATGDGAPVRAARQSLLGPADRRQSLGERFGDRVVGPLGDQELRGITHVTVLVGRRTVRFAITPHGVEQMLDARSFGIQ